jgi:hypothetical protein
MRTNAARIANNPDVAVAGGAKKRFQGRLSRSCDEIPGLRFFSGDADSPSRISLARALERRVLRQIQRIIVTVGFRIASASESDVVRWRILAPIRNLLSALPSVLQKSFKPPNL